MSQKVFLSYADEDTALVRAVTDRLPELLQTNAKALEVFNAQTDVHIGENFRQRIKIEMETAGTVVFFSSPNSDKSQWVSYEAGMAEALGKNVVIVGRKGVGKSSLLRNFGSSVRTVEID
jgi:putative ribosome biogenesis GTPase RsgA